MRKDTNRSPMPGVDGNRKMGFDGNNKWKAICGRYIDREEESGCTERGTELAKQGVKDGEFEPMQLPILGYIIHLPCKNMLSLWKSRMRCGMENIFTYAVGMNIARRQI